MKTSHEDKADGGDDETGQFHFFVVCDTSGEIIANLLVEAHDQYANNHRDEAHDTPDWLKFPIHISILL